MSKLLGGRVSFLTFLPEKKAPDSDDLRKKLFDQRFHPLLPEDVRDESVGWVDPFLSFENQAFPNCYFRDYYLFSLRIDRYSLGGAQLRPFLEEEIHRFKEDNKVEFIPAHQKKELRERAMRRVRVKTLPRTIITEAAWNLGENKLYLFTQSSTIISKFIDTFEKTFAISIAPSYLVDAVEKLDKPGDLTSIIGELWDLGGGEE
ncbi:MAG TPA: recombination-associated protein RdgC [bacterium]|nr:recombination-associated protein RdgC [bacterium]